MKEGLTKENMINSETKQIPTGVKIISVLYYIGSFMFVLSSILFFVGAGFIGSITEGVSIFGTFGPGLFIVGGIILIGLGILYFFIGRGLWKGKNWARIVAIIFSIFGILIVIVSMIQGNVLSNIVGLAIQLTIAGYLLFSNSVKEAFNKGNKNFQ